MGEAVCGIGRSGARGAAFAAALVEISETLAAAGVSFVVAPMPTRSGPLAGQGLIDRVVGELRLVVLDLATPIRTRLERDGQRHADLFWRFDGHLNEYGHEVVAAAIAEAGEDRLLRRR